MRQEFWELEILGTITALHFYGKLNADNTMGDRQKSMISWFHKRREQTLCQKLCTKHCAGDQKILIWSGHIVTRTWHLVKTNSAIDNMPVDEKTASTKHKCKTEDFQIKRQKN